MAIEIVIPFKSHLPVGRIARGNNFCWVPGALLLARANYGSWNNDENYLLAFYFSHSITKCAEERCSLISTSFGTRMCKIYSPMFSEIIICGLKCRENTTAQTFLFSHIVSNVCLLYIGFDQVVCALPLMKSGMKVKIWILSVRD